jgi:serine/arginine repetitive matrix protein 2
MYNGIGLSTARGSGTSGYVQKNLAFVKQKQMMGNYKEVLQKFKENPAPPKKRANIDIIEHEKKHKIESELFMLAEELKAENKSEEEIQKTINDKREQLYKKVLSGDKSYIEYIIIFNFVVCKKLINNQN